MIYFFKTWNGETEKCTYGLLHSLLDIRELILPTKVVELFFSLLQSTVGNCSAVSPSFATQNIFFPLEAESCYLSSRASSAAARLLLDKAKAALRSADIIFFPFLDKRSGQWNLIAFTKSKKKENKNEKSKNMHCLYFFDGAGDAIENRISMAERHLLR